MKNLLKIELNRAFFSKWFAVSLLLGMVLAIISAWQTAAIFMEKMGRLPILNTAWPIV